MAGIENVEYAVGDAVDVADIKELESLTRYGRIKEILPTGRVVVHFKEPNRPNVCARCGCPRYGLSEGSTGEIVCMVGCGHEHGFREWDIEVPAETIRSNITRSRAKIREQKRLQELAQ